MFHAPRKTGRALAIAVALGAIAAPGALAKPSDLRTPDARDAAAPAHVVQDVRTAPTWPSDPRSIAAPRALPDAPASGLDWGSAGIGAGATMATFSLALAGFVGLRRRRTARAGSLAAH
jgi:hypothetical protein